MSESKESAIAALAALGLTIESAFVPFSQSRNKLEKHKTLNWRVTLCRNGKGFLTCDYSAGIAHCPGYKFQGSVPHDFRSLRYVPKGGGTFANGKTSRMEEPGERAKRFRAELAGAECETGRAMFYPNFQRGEDFSPLPESKGGPIKPDSVDVFYSVVMDSSILDHATYESWASDYGYDPDSIKGESVYRLCLSHALALRAAIGESGIESLNIAFQDY